MSNEIGGLGEGLDIGGSPRQDVNKVTEEDVTRIQEESKQAQQVHQQIQKDKKSNNKLANFLSFLLQDIKDEKVISLIYSLFFKIKDKNTGTNYLRKKINTFVIVGFFFPFYPKETKKFGITDFFEDLTSGEPINLTGYINYIKRLSAKYHDNIALEPDILVDFLITIIEYFEIKQPETQKLDEDQDNNTKENLKLHIKNELYK